MLTPLSILIVDDEIELATLFKNYIEAMGLDAISFTNSLLALEYFKDTFDKHSLIIADMRMPGMNGIELAKRIRQINSKIKIFLMTAFDISDLENNSDYKAARIDKLLQKPVHLSNLRKMINTSLKK